MMPISTRSNPVPVTSRTDHGFVNSARTPSLVHEMPACGLSCWQVEISLFQTGLRAKGDNLVTVDIGVLVVHTPEVCLAEPLAW